MPEIDVRLLVTIRVYDGTAEEACAALSDRLPGFDLPGGGEAEILSAEIAEDVTPDE